MAIVAAMIVFLGTALVCGMMLLARWQTLVEEQGEIARRIGPALTRERSILRHRSDLLAGVLGPRGNAIHHLLRRAGSDQTVTEVVVRVAVMGMMGLLAGALLLGAIGALLVGAVAGLWPLWRLRRQAARREHEVTRLLPGAIDLVVRSLQAGHGLSDALRLAGAETPDPLGRELKDMMEQQRLGLPMVACMENLMERLPGHLEVSLLVSAVLLHRETGGNLIESLENLAQTIRERLLFDQRVKAMTSEVRMSGWILGGLPVATALLILVLVPGYLNPLWVDPLGQIALGVVGVMMVLGGLVMRRLADVTS